MRLPPYWTQSSVSRPRLNLPPLSYNKPQAKTVRRIKSTVLPAIAFLTFFSITAFGVWDQQSKLGQTQAYIESEGLEPSLNRSLPPPTVNTVQITMETLSFVVVTLVGAFWVLYQTLVNKIYDVSDSQDRDDRLVDKRIDEIALSIVALEGTITLLEERIATLNKQMEQEQSRSERRNNWATAHINNLTQFAQSQLGYDRCATDELDSRGMFDAGD